MPVGHVHDNVTKFSALSGCGMKNLFTKLAVAAKLACMFTGIVEELQTVLDMQQFDGVARLSFACSFADSCALGDSVAVNGVCLTVADKQAGMLSFDVLAQTMQVTALGRLQQGSKVNLERAMGLQARLGGHMVSGHVDGTASVVAYSQQGQDHSLQLQLPPQLLAYCIDKGSLCVDGISLTIAEIKGDILQFWITPHTHAVTNLSARVAGDEVNIEVDMLAKYVERLLDARLSQLNK